MSFAGFPGPPIPPGPPGPPPPPDTHALLGPRHVDTITAAPGVGGLIASITGVWERLAPGAELDHLIIVGGVPTWAALAGSGLGDVTGPSSSDDGYVAVFDGTSGKMIRQALVNIDGAGNLTVAGNTIISGDLTVLGNITGLDLAASGFVVGPASATDSALALYDGVTGKLIKDSAITSNGSGLVLPGDLTVNGDTILNDVDILGNTTVSGLTTLTDLDVTNNVTISGTLTATGGIVGIDLAASGFVVGPASATDSALALYDGTTGELIKDSNITSDGDSLVVPNSITAQFLTVASGANLPAFDILNVNATGISNLATVASGTWNGDVITEVYGGTGRSTYNAGDILYSDAANSLTTLASGSAEQVLSIVAGALAWKTLAAAAGGAVSVLVVTTPAATLTNTDYLAAASGAGTAQTINLPPSPADGQRHVVKDSVGVASTGNITVDGNGALIDEFSTVQLVNDYESVSVIFSAALGRWQLV